MLKTANWLFALGIIPADEGYVEAAKEAGAVWTRIDRITDDSNPDDLMVLNKTLGDCRIIYIFNNSSRPGRFRLAVEPSRYAYLYDAQSTQVNQECELLEAYYDSEIRFVDDHIGTLIDDLKKRGLYDNSLIVFMSDHGEEFGEHGAYFHGSTLYNQALSVPLIIKLPRQDSGRLVKGRFALLDIFPTIMGFLNPDISSLGLEGSRFDLKNQKEVRERDIFSTTDSSVKLRCAQSSKYKYILKTDDKERSLYDLSHDAEETRSIFSKESDVCRALERIVLDYEDRINRSDTGEKLQTLTDEEKEKLRSLGYLAN